MKPRTVVVTLQIETDAPLASLRVRSNWKFDNYVDLCVIRQVQVNVAQQPKPAKKRKRPC